MKLTKVLFETSNDLLGFSSVEEFRQAWKDGMIDGCFYIESKNIETVKEIVKTKK